MIAVGLRISRHRAPHSQAWNSNLNILVASTEIAPFAKTGGLADVCGALPTELSRLGEHVAGIMPAFRQALTCGQEIAPTDCEFQIEIAGTLRKGRLLQSVLPNTDAPVYLIEQPHYYDRAEIYFENGQDYPDNCERFIFFCRAVLEVIRLRGMPVDVIHCNDWPTCMIPALLKLEHADTPEFAKIRTLLTIHNMAYQGHFDGGCMSLTGLSADHFNPEEMEFHGGLNFLKTGVVFADALNTVSERYATEIQSPPLGCGLESLLASRHDQVSGIINGVDYSTWNPTTDPYLPQNYDIDSWQTGKAICKQALQERVGLQQSQEIPLIGLVGRLAGQKGWDLVARVMERWAPEREVQWVVLGTGEPRFHDLLNQLVKDYPTKIAASFTFSDELAHWIEAGADLFVMPSQYEPCGLNQLYSLKYGTVPVVRATGGLADTINGFSPEVTANGTTNGFSFEAYEADDLEMSLDLACDLFCNNQEVWSHLVETGMQQDWSWSRSAERYVSLYRSMLATETNSTSQQ